MYVLQRPCKLPIAPMGKWLTCLLCFSLAQLRTTLRSTTGGACHRDIESSHRPDGIFTCFALMLAGRRCVHQRWHGELFIVHHRQRSWLCACSHSKLPIAPMGFCLVDMSISILILYDGCCLDLSVSSTCHLRLKKPNFPSPRWENALP